MTKDDIIKYPTPGHYTTEQMLAWGKANAEAEREACAKLVVGLFDPEDAVAEFIAKAIRARTTP
jgi:hypothetical protein